MRRTVLPMVVVLVVTLAGFTPAGAEPAHSPERASAGPAAAETQPARHDHAHVADAWRPVEVTDEIDVTRLVPALQDAFGGRYGGYWIEGEGESGVLHVGIVDADEADRAFVALLTAEDPRVVTEPVDVGYDALVAASDEIAASLDPDAGNFAVGIDEASNAVVVETEAADPEPTQEVADQAARRGAARAQPQAEDDVADSVEVESQTTIEILPATSSRNAFPPFEPGLSIRVYTGGGTINQCTTGFMFRNYFGNFGSTAGHCGRVNSGVVIGPRLVDRIRANGYYSTNRVIGDVGSTSLSVLRWSGWNVIHLQNGNHRIVNAKLSNTQISNGLRLCYQGVASNGVNHCGHVVRANTTLCCDAAGKTYVYSCTNAPGRAGDSGGPVYQPVGGGHARAAGMLSSTVTIDGSRLMCFSRVAGLERALNATMVVH